MPNDNFDELLDSLLNQPPQSDRYRKQIDRLLEAGFSSTDNIKETVEKAIQHIKLGEHNDPFVIHGEPQSGKTSMMIALTAKLLDQGHKIIIILLNDRTSLLNQNLKRFTESGLNPTPANHSEILDDDVQISKNTELVVFCKKNTHNLTALLRKIGRFANKVVMDDEADFATPDSNVNKEEHDPTKINELVGNLLENGGIYIGVTATPARLDLNNTYMNNSERWVEFKPHDLYTGPDIFFPSEGDISNIEFEYGLILLPNHDAGPEYLRTALFRFLVNVAYLNHQEGAAKNYVMLVHTSGIKADHAEDYKQIAQTFSILEERKGDRFKRYIKTIYELSGEKDEDLKDDILKFILDNLRRRKIIVMNSKPAADKGSYDLAMQPKTPFTIAIGGNIVSRGITFDNLLTMFFTRDTKHKIQQDTYIQRARMFGNRGKYLQHFELHIPRKLYGTWHECFMYNRLALASLRDGTPVWLYNSRTRPVATGSIDRSAVVSSSGEMSFGIFEYGERVDALVAGLQNPIPKLQSLAEILGENALPQYLLNFINVFSSDNDTLLAIHGTGSINSYKDADTENISRRKGLIGQRELELQKYPEAVHHIKIFRNHAFKARLFYKYTSVNVGFISRNKKKFA